MSGKAEKKRRKQYRRQMHRIAAGDFELYRVQVRRYVGKLKAALIIALVGWAMTAAVLVGVLI